MYVNPDLKPTYQTWVDGIALCQQVGGAVLRLEGELVRKKMREETIGEMWTGALPVEDAGYFFYVDEKGDVRKMKYKIRR